MKRLWKIVSLLCAFGILLTLPVFAGGDNVNLPDNSAVVEIPCKYCGANMEQTYQRASNWFTIDYDDCKCEGGYSPMHDRIVQQHIVSIYSCAHCHRTESMMETVTKRGHFFPGHEIQPHLLYDIKA